MALEAIGFGLTVAGFAKALPEILKCAQDILASKQNSYELKRQKRKFDRYVSKVETELKRLLRNKPRRVPKDLLRASLALVKYCKGCIFKADNFYKRFEADPWTFRFMTHVARVFGKDRIRLLRIRLGEGEDWLRIALATVALNENQEATQADIETRLQYKHRAEQLRHDLEKAERYRDDFPARMKHMNKARVDYRCIAHHAHAIAHSPVFEGSDLSSSSMAISASPSGSEHVSQGTHLHPPPRAYFYEQTATPTYRDFGGYPESEIPEVRGAPLGTWVNAWAEPVWINDPCYDPLSRVSHYQSATWGPTLRHGWLPQDPTPRVPSEAASRIPRSRQRHHNIGNVRVVNTSSTNPWVTGNTERDAMNIPNHPARTYQAPQPAAPPPGSDSAPSMAPRPIYTGSRGARASSQRSEVPLTHQRSSVSSKRPSHTGLGSEVADADDPGTGPGAYTSPASRNGSNDPHSIQHTAGGASPQTTQTRPGPRTNRDPALKTEDSPNAKRPLYIHIETRSSSSRSRSSSQAESSPSTTFSRARGPTSSVASSPATSFTIPSTGSARDSGYSSGGSVCEPNVDTDLHRPADSRYPPNSHETRRGGYDVMKERRRSRRGKDRER